MNTQELNRVLSYADTLFFKKSDSVLLEGNHADSFFYLQHGSLDVSYNAQGSKITVALIGGGDFFGETGYFEKTTRVRNIHCSENSEIKVFNDKTIQNLKAEASDLYGSLMAHLAFLISKKLLRILEENGPMAAYSASLLGKGKHYSEARPVPDEVLKSKAWQEITQKTENFKALFFDFAHLVQHAPGDKLDQKLEEKGVALLDDFNNTLPRFDELARSTKNEDTIWGYIFKEVFPYLMRSHFAEKAYYKPKGYAGDFEMIEMIYQNQPRGDGKLGTLIDGWILNVQGSKAVRGRRKLLTNLLLSLTKKKKKRSKPIKIMNLACGSNRELFDFIKQCDYSEKIEAICMDIDADALQFTSSHVNVFPHKANILLMKENLVRWALKTSNQNIPGQDIIYSSGVMDYFDDKLFLAVVSRCYDFLKPGGKLIVGNFSPFRDQVLMDRILNWQLIYRTKADLARLFNNSPFAGKVEIISEAENINQFAIASK